MFAFRQRETQRIGSRPKLHLRYRWKHCVKTLLKRQRTHTYSVNSCSCIWNHNTIAAAIHDSCTPHERQTFFWIIIDGRFFMILNSESHVFLPPRVRYILGFKLFVIRTSADLLYIYLYITCMYFIGSESRVESCAAVKYSQVVM